MRFGSAKLPFISVNLKNKAKNYFLKQSSYSRLKNSNEYKMIQLTNLDNYRMIKLN